MTATSTPTAPTAPTAPTLESTFAEALPVLATASTPDAVADPHLVVLNEPLARELGLDAEWLRSPEGVAVLAGSSTLDAPDPVAMGYAGHQFGGYSPRLGDGRAVLLGELVTPDDRRVDLHLKGTGRTPYSRGGDGKATLGPMLREFLFAEALHALGVPTTRALAVTGTGERVAREQMLPGAVLTRVASSHLRVGTFEYVVRMGDRDLLRRLVDYSVERHYPHLADADNRALALFDAVVDAQARLVAQWMQIGFIHGVLNTDNVTIGGETIDYGPCAFMDRFDPATVYSSIDHAGRYAFGNQPTITGWNLARLAETLIPIIDDDSDTAVALVTEVLDSFASRFQIAWRTGMLAKLGVFDADATDGTQATDEAMVDDFLSLLRANDADYTSSFRALSASLRGDDSAIADTIGTGADVDAWIARWRDRFPGDVDHAELATVMDRTNPLYIPRNHTVDAALRAAEVGDIAPFSELLSFVTHPYDHRDDSAEFAGPAPEAFDDGFRTFCGT